MNPASPAAIAESLSGLGRAAETTESLARASRVEDLSRLTKIAADTDEGARAAKALEAASKSVRPFDAADTAIRAAARVKAPSVLTVLGLSVRGALSQVQFVSRLSQIDRMAILTEVIQRLLRVSERGALDVTALLNLKVLRGYAVQVAGVMREVYGRNLGKIANAVLKLRFETMALRRATPGLEIIDSALIGAVKSPTRWKAGSRTLALGTDRIVGVGLRDPHLITETLEDGTKAMFRIEGELDIRIAVEVKGRTTATDGIGQFVKLQRRGNQGYVQIGDQIWLVKRYRADQVEHFLVAPAGQELNRATQEAASLRGLGIRIETVEIPAKQEAEIVNSANQLVGDVAKQAGSRPKAP